MLGKPSHCKPRSVQTAWLYGPCCLLQIVIHLYQHDTEWIWICWPRWLLPTPRASLALPAFLFFIWHGLHLLKPILHLCIESGSSLWLWPVCLRVQFSKSCVTCTFCTSRILCKHLKQLCVKIQAARAGTLSAVRQLWLARLLEPIWFYDPGSLVLPF